jgi:hypothetical protein
MNSPPSGPVKDDEDHHCDTVLNLSVAKLDVYRHERLGYTEIPAKSSAPGKSKRTAAVLKGMYHWVLSHL